MKCAPEGGLGYALRGRYRAIAGGAGEAVLIVIGPRLSPVRHRVTGGPPARLVPARLAQRGAEASLEGLAKESWNVRRGLPGSATLWKGQGFGLPAVIGLLQIELAWIGVSLGL